MRDISHHSVIRRPDHAFEGHRSSSVESWDEAWVINKSAWDIAIVRYDETKGHIERTTLIGISPILDEAIAEDDQCAIFYSFKERDYLHVLSRLSMRRNMWFRSVWAQQ